MLECTATMLNINYGHNEVLMKSCKRLSDYASFVECVRSAQKQGLDNAAAIRVAMDECIEQGILTDLLIKQRAEVFHMLLTEFDEKKYKKRLKREVEEARLEAEAKKREVERLQTILIYHNIPLDEVIED